MSVYKSRRKDAAAQFIVDARELRKTTMRIVQKFPKSYRWIVTNNMLQLAGDIYVNCVKANGIYLHEKMPEEDYKLRRHYLQVAITSCEALLAEITFCYELVSGGNNFFDGRYDYNRAFSTWTEQGNEALRKIRALEGNDKTRWSKWNKE